MFWLDNSSFERRINVVMCCESMLFSYECWVEALGLRWGIYFGGGEDRIGVLEFE